MTQADHDYHLAQQWLHDVVGKDAQFRKGQWEAISALAHKRQSTFVIQRTGWGKSLVYFIASKLLRHHHQGMTLLISPLLSLMRDQIRAAEKLGLQAVTINSTNPLEHADIQESLENHNIDLLLISPERLGNNAFRRETWSVIQHQLGLIVVDEAHCISDWGHDFRPSYRRIMHILQTLPEHPPILATTATANNRVIQDVAQIIGQNTVIVRGSLTRSSLSLHIYNEPQPASYRMALVAELLGRLEGSGIIYCTTTRDCRLVSDYLNQQGHETHPYYSNVEELGYEREDLERALLENDVKALVASVALGMGFDKPDLGFVIHYQHPNSIIAYYQQIGRAGRGIDNAYIILLHGMEDLQIQEYFIENAFPTRQQVREVLQVLRDKGISKLSDISTQVNIRKSVLDNILTHLEVEGIVHYEVQNRTYRLLDAQREPDYARWASVTEQRYGELKQMTDYYQHEGCLMHYIATLLEDPHPVKHCGKCQNCLKRKPHTTPTEAQKKFAEEFLDTGDFMMLKPRKQWATSLKQEDAELSGRIAEDLRNAEGYILSSYFDDVWGRYVREGKYHHQHFDDALVEESARRLQPVIQEKGIAWITNIGSLRHPDLVPSFARRLAQQLSLPYYVCQDNLRERPEQKTMQNSHHQVKNLLNTFTIQKDLPQAPVLLVDDIVDSGWTLTVVGYKLRQAGCEAVYPFALATTKR